MRELLELQTLQCLVLEKGESKKYSLKRKYIYLFIYPYRIQNESKVSRSGRRRKEEIFKVLYLRKWANNSMGEGRSIKGLMSPSTSECSHAIIFTERSCVLSIDLTLRPAKRL